MRVLKNFKQSKIKISALVLLVVLVSMQNTSAFSGTVYGSAQSNVNIPYGSAYWNSQYVRFQGMQYVRLDALGALILHAAGYFVTSGSAGYCESMELAFGGINGDSDVGTVRIIAGSSGGYIGGGDVTYYRDVSPIPRFIYHIVFFISYASPAGSRIYVIVMTIMPTNGHALVSGEMDLPCNFFYQ